MHPQGLGPAASPSPLSFAQAVASVAAQAAHLLQGPPATQEVLPLAGAVGRVLAAPILAGRDQPPFDRATRDGYAVRAEDVARQQPLRVLGLLRAGEMWPAHRPALAAGECIEIMTGAPMPPGADAVLMVEHAEQVPSADGEFVRPAAGRALQAGDNVVPRGSEARRGSLLVTPGTRLGVPQIAIAAGCGLAHLPVYAQPRVAILATGDELVEPGADTPDIAPCQIYNSNSHSTAALVQQAGAVPLRLPIARDHHDDLADGIRAGLETDLLLLTGGVSMGKYDLVEDVLASLGAEFFFTSVRIQPGKPLVFGRVPASGSHAARYFLGLPGNPLSTMVTFALFVRPLLAALAGEQGWQPPFALARLTADLHHAPGLTRFLPAWLEPPPLPTSPSDAPGPIGGPSVTPVPWHGSGDLAANARANCYLVAPEDQPHLSAGSCVRILLR